MAYCSVIDVKEYLGISQGDDDNLIGDLIDRAQKAIDIYTGRVFESSANATRYYTVGEDTMNEWLFLDEDLAEINSITTNADASSPTTLVSTDYVTEPRNSTPYHAIKLLSSSSKSWTYTDDPETGIEVSGKWAFSTTAPNDIVHACIRLTGYYYRQKDAQVFDVTTIPEAGVITVPQGIPRDVAKVLEPYVKVL